MSSATGPVGPRVIGLDLFNELDSRLINLLAGLGPDDWHLPTVCTQWTVKDIASHILDTSCRRLSFGRDRHRPRVPVGALAGYDDVLRHIHTLNAEWTVATDRVSPQVLLDLLRVVLPQSSKHLTSLRPMEPGLGVLWAGEAVSQNWMDVAREYTERWHHQQQVAIAVGRSSGITSRELYHPALETFLRALPFTLRGIRRPPGISMRVTVRGDSGGEWHACRGENDWVLSHEGSNAVAASVSIPQDDAWLMFTKRWDRATKAIRFSGVRIEGDLELGSKIWDMVSIMA